VLGAAGARTGARVALRCLVPLHRLPLPSGRTYIHSFIHTYIPAIIFRRRRPSDLLSHFPFHLPHPTCNLHTSSLSIGQLPCTDSAQLLHCLATQLTTPASSPISRYIQNPSLAPLPTMCFGGGDRKEDVEGAAKNRESAYLSFLPICPPLHCALY
jgi:hypothetical protein